MFDATSPCEPQAPTPALPRQERERGQEPGRAFLPLPQSGGGPGWGRLALSFTCRDGSTHLSHLYQKTPLRAFFPRHDCGDLAVAAIANVGGGFVAGDTFGIDLRLGAGAAALVTTQAAEKVYRSTGPDCRLDTSLHVAQGGWLEWCPQETILFDRARLRRTLRLELADGARAMLGEIVVLGRLASGERAGRGLLHDRIEVRVDGALRWRDSLRLDGDYARVVDAPAGLAGARCFATFVYGGPDAGERIDLARALLPDEGAGATVVNGLLIARLLAHDPLALRRAFALFWTRFRAAVAGLPPRLPRLWHV